MGLIHIILGFLCIMLLYALLTRTRLFMGACYGTETTIYLPKDSIVKDFDIDVTN